MKLVSYMKRCTKDAKRERTCSFRRWRDDLKGRKGEEEAREGQLEAPSSDETDASLSFVRRRVLKLTMVAESRNGGTVDFASLKNR